MKKIIKRSLIGLGIFLFVLIAAVIAIPYFFKDKLAEFAKQQINQNVNAKVDFKDVNLSLWRTFPDFSFSLNGLTVDGKGEFDGLRLAEMESMDFTLDLMSVWNMATQPIDVKSFALNKPKLHVLVTKDGKANYDIAIPSDEKKETSSSGDFALKLKKYGIYNGDIIYDDRSTGTYLETKNLTHTGRADFTSTIYDIATKTTADALTLAYGGVSYIHKVKLGADLTLNADMDKMAFTLKDNSVSMNDLTLNFEGNVVMPKEDINMDLKFDAPKAKFSSLLSLVPAAYTADYKDVETNGTAAFNGFVKGVYNEKSMPAFGLNIMAENAYFKYPSLPMPVKDIALKANINCPSNNYDQVVVDVSKFHINLGGNPFDATLNLKTPISDPQINTNINGTINLGDLAKAFPMEGVKEMSGIVKANIKADTRMSYVEQEQYEKVNMQGKLSIINMKYNAVDMPPVLIRDLNTEFTPNNVKLYNFDAQLGKSDLKANGTLDNVLTYFSRDKVMKGNITMASHFFDANEWMGGSETADSKTTTTTSTTQKTPSPAEQEAVFDKFDFTGNISFDKIVYENYNILNTKAKGNFTPAKAKLESFSTNIYDSDIAASGEVSNWWNYLFSNEKITGTLKVDCKNLDLNPFMAVSATPATGTQTATTATTTSTASEPILVPANIDFVLNGNFGRLVYDTYELKEAVGALTIRNQKVEFNRFSAKFLGGAFNMNGSYTTTDPKKPAFALGLNIDKFQFEQTAQKILTIKAFAPIIEYIKGAFNANFNVKGTLKPDLMPELTSIESDGLLQTIDAVVKEFKPLTEVASKTGLAQLRNINLKNTTNFFKIKDGKFSIEPMNFKFDDVAMNLSGSHGLNTDMDYTSILEVPKAKLSQGAAGAAAVGFLNEMSSQASKVGVSLSNSDFVKFAVTLKGSMLNPKIGIKFLDAPKMSTIKDQLVDKGKEELEKRKKELEDKARAEADKLKAEAEAKIKAEADKLKSAAEQKAKEVADKAKAEADRLRAEAEKKAKEAAEKAKEELKNKGKDAIKNLPNPFKKN